MDHQAIELVCERDTKLARLALCCGHRDHQVAQHCFGLCRNIPFKQSEREHVRGFILATKITVEGLNLAVISEEETHLAVGQFQAA